MSIVWNLVLLSVDIEFPEAGVLRWRVAGGSWPHPVTGVDNERKEEMKSAGMACDLIVAFVVSCRKLTFHRQARSGCVFYVRRLI